MNIPEYTVLQHLVNSEIKDIDSKVDLKVWIILFHAFTVGTALTVDQIVDRTGYAKRLTNMALRRLRTMNLVEEIGKKNAVYKLIPRV